jgi:hypothetical protein
VNSHKHVKGNSGSVSEGSNPSPAAPHKPLLKGFSLLLDHLNPHRSP